MVNSPCSNLSVLPSPSFKRTCLPAGLGDMAVGITAPWIVLSLIRQPEFAISTAFLRWNVLGILDLILAVSIATLSSTLASGTPGEISTTPMATLPLVLIPAFFVLVFLMLHATALMQRRQIIRIEHKD